MSRFTDKPNATYMQALTALRKLLDERGLDDVTRVYADATWETARDDYVTFHRLKSPEDAHVCVYRLKGERCPDEFCDSPTCIPGMDHGSEWERDGNTFVIVSQPYRFSYRVVKQTVEFCEANGLAADISTRPSWHFPGAVLTVTYKRVP
jgi:hypothetical protein